MGPAPRHGHGLVLYQLRLEPVQLRTKAMNAKTVEPAGIETHQILLMVNTNSPGRAANCRASICPIDKGLKLQATSSKLQAARKNYVNYVIIWTRTLARARSCELRVHLVRVSSSKRATICHIDTRCSCDIMSY